MSSMQLTILVIGISPLLALSIMVAKARGRGEIQEIGHLTQQGWLLGLVISLIAMIVFWFISPILLFFGQDPHLVALVIPYFHWMIWGVPAAFINVVNSQVAAGLGKQKIMTIIIIIQTILTVFCGNVLIHGLFGFPALGIAGWGISVVIGLYIQLILTWSIFNILPEIKQYHLFKKHLRNKWKHLKELAQLGWPITVQSGGELLSFGFVIFMAGWLGYIPLASQQTIIQLLVIMLMPVMGVTMAAGIVIGKTMGMKNFHDVKMYAKAVVFLTLILSISMSFLVNVFSTQVIHFFVHPGQPHYDELMHTTKVILFVASISQVFDALRNSFTGIFRGLYDTRVPMYIGLLSIWLVRVPLAYFFAFTLHMGIIGLSLSSVIGMALGAYLLWRRWMWRKDKLALIGHS
jgi:MATE family multidrug resistance protein